MESQIQMKLPEINEVNENKSVAKQGGSVAKVAREQIELETGKPVITDENFLPNQGKPKQIRKED